MQKLQFTLIFRIKLHRSMLYRAWYVSSMSVFSIFVFLIFDFSVQAICTLMPGHKNGLTWVCLRTWRWSEAGCSTSKTFKLCTLPVCLTDISVFFSLHARILIYLSCMIVVVFFLLPHFVQGCNHCDFSCLQTFLCSFILPSYTCYAA